MACPQKSGCWLFQLFEWFYPHSVSVNNQRHEPNNSATLFVCQVHNNRRPSLTCMSKGVLDLTRCRSRIPVGKTSPTLPEAAHRGLENQRSAHYGTYLRGSDSRTGYSRRVRSSSLARSHTSHGGSFRGNGWLCSQHYLNHFRPMLADRTRAKLGSLLIGL